MAAVPVDPDRDSARSWLEAELDRPGYAVRESWVRRALTWLRDRLPDLSLDGQLPAWTSWVAIALVVAAVAGLLWFAARDRWRRAGLTGAPRGDRVFGAEGQLSAAAYRERSRSSATAGDLDSALLDGYRAVTAAAHERSVLDAAPARTAHEVAVRLAAVFPAHAGDLGVAADRFDAVRYGGRHADAEQVAQVHALDEALAAPTSLPAPTGPLPAPTGPPR
ncbi:DUF4129 domain-containing protein [Ornithinimicrobium tianjinense]|uniref:DUF4129 domain-containing protein n=1 Tax=Ornithinimicrobium tianjinense TaxID=1195761 RepID=UPI00166B04A8|nr:DUF4129 domain-containing protein [Ornithinimicrobium tianjinense]